MSQLTTSLAVVNASSNQLARAVQGLQTQRTERGKAPANPRLDVEGQVDDVLLVLALLGEALVPLGVFEDAYYTNTLFEVQTAIASCGHDVVLELFEKLADELKYLVTAGFTICAIFSPMHVYRGFGACVFGDWNWACPDFEYLEKKVKKETSLFSTKKPDPQPNRPVLLAFDRAIQVLQVKPMAFLAKRPSISTFGEQQPRYGPRPKKEVRDALSDCEDFGKELDRRGHPAPPGQKISSWGMPWAGWTSTFSCQLTKDWELVLFHQMDPGRLLHAFLCRGSLNLHQGQLITLPPATPAESIVCWLENLPGFTHTIVGWETFLTSDFEKKAGKKMAKKIGQYPLPSKYVIRDPNAPPAKAAVSSRLSMPALPARTRTTSGTLTPPPYSPALSDDTLGDRHFPLPEKSHTFSEVEGNAVGPSRTVGHIIEEPSELSTMKTPTSPTAPSLPTHAASVPPPTKPPTSPSPDLPVKSATISVRRKLAPNSSIDGETWSSQSSVPSVGTLGSRNGLGSTLSSTASVLEPPARPPKLPVEMDPTPSAISIVSQLENTRNHTLSAMQNDLSARYLQLLHAVAEGTITPQQLREILNHGASIPSLTAEPQELDSDPAPPKFAGITIPRGEMRYFSQSNASGQHIASTFKSGTGT